MVLEGYRAIRRAVDNDFKLDDLYVCDELFLGTNEPILIQEAADAGTRIISVAVEPFRKMATRERPEGLLAVALQNRRQLTDLNQNSTIVAPHKPLYLILEGIEKPGNLGTILRSADGAGVTAVIACETRTDIVHPEVIQASAGAFFSVSIYEETSEEALAWCRRHDIYIISTSPFASICYTDAPMTQPLAIVIGSEQYGLSQTWLEQADQQVYLPMLGQADSLNAATAATLLIYEAVRQRA